MKKCKHDSTNKFKLLYRYLWSPQRSLFSNHWIIDSVWYGSNKCTSPSNLGMNSTFLLHKRMPFTLV